MSRHVYLSHATRDAIGAVHFERTPDRVNTNWRQWRVWHHEHFGGSPIPVRVREGECLSHRRLYLGPSRFELGDVDHPEVDAIVNLCELDDPWPLCSDDRRWPRGEGMFGYSWQQLDDDTDGVVDLLQRDRCVLVHCMAGVNRSSTLVCATLMRLEGLTARQALERIRRFHPIADPEDQHWQVLRQLEVLNASGD